MPGRVAAATIRRKMAGNRKNTGRAWLLTERAAWIAGFALVGIALAGYAHRHLGSRADVEAFEAARQAARAAAQPARETDVPEAAPPAALPVPVPPAPPAPAAEEALAGLEAEAVPDFSLWSKKRIDDYRQARSADTRTPVAMLRIPELDIQVAVLEGTDEVTLNRGVGHIDGTPMPGEGGNMGLAGHRDGFFRPLKDVETGTRIELVTLTESLTYRVTDVWIVDPSDVSVLADTAEPAITLVTCYPFYFVGDAPQRYIVRAVLDQPGSAGAGAAAAGGGA